MISLVILNHHRLVRDGWYMYLSAQPGIRVLGMTGDYLEASYLAGRGRGCIILAYSDLGIGLYTLHALHRASPLARIIIVTPSCPEDILTQLRPLGVLACLSRNSSLEEIYTAVLRVENGQRYLPMPASPDLSDHISATGLTKRELEVAGLLGMGKTSGEIAAKLRISPKTIEVYRGNILKKLDCRNTAHLVRKLTANSFDYQHPSNK